MLLTLKEKKKQQNNNTEPQQNPLNKSTLVFTFWFPPVATWNKATITVLLYHIIPC